MSRGSLELGGIVAHILVGSAGSALALGHERRHQNPEEETGDETERLDGTHGGVECGFLWKTIDRPTFVESISGKIIPKF
jgi:hypothetical protein